jgi:hypothetical protein
MRISNKLTPTILLTIGLLSACNNGNGALHKEAEYVAEADSEGSVFRNALIAQWKAQPSQLFADFTELCRKTFVGKTLQEANATMRAAGQKADLAKIREPAVLTPAGTTPYAGGLGLHSSLISGASFNIVMYLDSATPSAALMVKDVRCGVREVSL